MLNVQPGPRDRRLLSALLILGVVAVTFYIVSQLTDLFFYFGDIFLTFFLAWLLAFIISPIVTRIVDLIPRLPRAAATILVYSAVVLILVVLVVVAAGALATSIGEFAASLPGIREDLPEILADKERTLGGERPVCGYQPEAIDLRDVSARRAFFEGVGRQSRKTLIVAEGLLVYLTEAEVASLASDLHAQSSFHWWVIDIASPKLLQMLRKRWDKTLGTGCATLKFAPAEGTAFFRRYGWKEVEFRSTWDESRRLKREMPMAWFWRLLSRFASGERREAIRRMSGIVLLERV